MSGRKVAAETERGLYNTARPCYGERAFVMRQPGSKASGLLVAASGKASSSELPSPVPMRSFGSAKAAEHTSRGAGRGWTSIHTGAIRANRCPCRELHNAALFFG